MADGSITLYKAGAQLPSPICHRGLHEHHLEYATQDIRRCNVEYRKNRLHDLSDEKLYTTFGSLHMQ